MSKKEDAILKDECSLEEILLSREERVKERERLLSLYSHPIISFTMNIAGPVKNSPLITRGFQAGLYEVFKVLDKEKIIYFKEERAKTGCAAFIVVDENALSLKQTLLKIEEESECGKLYDLDVIDKKGEKIERKSAGVGERKCLLCESDAKVCARGRKHSIKELEYITESLLREKVKSHFSSFVAEEAIRSLFYEVLTTPKPGLVDRTNSGSHTDMDIFTFTNSICSLYPYFLTISSLSIDTAVKSAEETFCKIREEGKKAEREMFRRTKGINTHKGAIFSLGLVTSAFSRLYLKENLTDDDVLKEVSAMAAGIAERDFKNSKEDLSYGERLYKEYGIKGVRGQAEEGFSVVKDIAMPVLLESLRRGLDINTALSITLLHIIANTEDTNIVKRSNIKKAEELREKMKETLRRTPYPEKEEIEKLDKLFIGKNLSPGGSADLLSITYFLYSVNHKEENSWLRL